MTDVVVPGDRAVRGSLETASARRGVVACPPHPQYGGSRRDGRLRAVSTALADRDIACLRFDFGPWDGGLGEQDDVTQAVLWAADRYESVGLFGYSFGAAIALLTAPTVSIESLSLLAPPASVAGVAADPVAALDNYSGPVQIVVGTRDNTVNSSPLVERARDCGGTVVELSADHFFIGNEAKVGELVADFFAQTLP